MGNQGKGDDPLVIAGRTYRSRLLVGTGKYKDLQQTYDAISASGAEIVTVALRRIDLAARGEDSMHDVLARLGVTYLPNSAGCYTAEEAVRTLRLARELGDWELVKLEVMADAHMLMPQPEETLRAAKMLVADGFQVMVYTTDDAALAKELEAAGCVAIMPLAAPIGSGLGIQRPERIEAIVRQSTVPVLVDAGVGTASDAAVAMELGCDGVLMNTAIAEAQDPVSMAKAMKLAVEAGRVAYLAGRMKKREVASPSSPMAGRISEQAGRV
ncbi:MAG: thiazole synthase [Opitutaceae bacterium]|nr:thiazole synthase [Opitutaceae bacterium]